MENSQQPINQTKNLYDGLREEIARCKELAEAYREIGAPGLFALTMIEMQIRNAEEAIAKMDTVAMIHCYQSLKGCE